MSTIIKAGEAARLVKCLRTVDLADHLAEVEAILARAREDSVRIIKEAQRERQRIFREAGERGRREGYEEGLREGTETGLQRAYDDAAKRFETEQADLVQTLERAASRLDKMKEDVRIAAEHDVLSLALKIARKLTFAIGELHPQSAVENLKRALRSVGAQSDLTIRIHPGDRASLETFASDLRERLDALKTVKLVEDDSVAAGGCKVECDRTSVDATLETQVDEIVSLLMGNRTEHGNAVSTPSTTD